MSVLIKTITVIDTRDEKGGLSVPTRSLLRLGNLIGVSGYGQGPDYIRPGQSPAMDRGVERAVSERNSFIARPRINRYHSRSGC